MRPLLALISSYTLHFGVHSPEKLCSAARRYGYTAVALTDKNNLYGLPLFLEACTRHGLKAIIGAEVDDGDTSALLYADGNDGYAHLCEIISSRLTDDTFALGKAVARYRAGIHVVTASQGLVRALAGSGQVYYRMSHPVRIPAWVRSSGIPVLLTAPVAFLSPDDYSVHALLAAIAGNTTLSKLDRSKLLPERAMMVDATELDERFELFDAVIAAAAEFARTITLPTGLGAIQMPRFTSAGDPGSGDTAALLRKKTIAGARKRYGTLTDTIMRRIEYELEIIVCKGFADYFLVVENIVHQSPRTCGRGSGAASIVAYALGITNVDPIRYNLMFERFLNPDRIDPPDIDIDFAWDERDAVLAYAFEHFGKAHTAMVANHLTFGARMALREVARVYGLCEHEISAVTKKIPWYMDLDESEGDIETACSDWPGLAGGAFDPPWPDIVREAARIVGLPCGIGTHCGGVVITARPIRTHVPVQQSAKGYPLIQWEKEGCEAMGLVKIDLLGNRSLAVIRDAVAMIKSTAQGQFDERTWDPQSDPETIRLLAEGRTMGVFYVESPAMRLLQRKSRAGDFDHLVIHSSIIRPAANKYIKEYIRRLHGGRWQPLHPLLEATLAETFGIMVYQEDVAKVAMALAGFSAAEADKLRKIMAKKSRGATFDDYRSRFFSGAAAQGVSEEVTGRIWEMMESFRGYSFCKPHSASYVQVSFQSAWLKAHFPAAFMAAVLSNYGGFYTTQAYISEAMRMGLRILSPDVNVSHVAYRACGTTVVVGLCQIKSLSHRAAVCIVDERIKHGTYRSLEDLLARTSVDESDAETLVLAGAADTLQPQHNRAELFWCMRRFFRTGKSGAVPALRASTRADFLRQQYQALGFLTSCHPITLAAAGQRPPLRAQNIDGAVGKVVTLFGWCVTSRTVSTSRGEAMEFVTFEDETGIFETVFFPDIYRRYSVMLSWQMAFRISGKITAEFGVSVLEVRSIERVRET